MRYLKLSNNTILPLQSHLAVNDTYQFVFSQTDEEFVTTTLPLLKIPSNMIELEILLADQQTSAIKDIQGYTVYTGYSSVTKDGETLITVTMCKEIKDIEKRLTDAEDKLSNKMPQLIEESKTAIESANTAIKKAEKAVSECDTYVQKVEELDKQVNPVVNFETMTLEQARDYKWNEMNEICQQEIYKGMDVTYQEQTSHYSLTESDQSNLITYNTKILSAVAMSGITEPDKLVEYLESVKFLYHADGESCREYSANEINAITTAAEKHKTYHTTLINKIHTWINREEDKNVLLAISYSYELLPEDLQTEMTTLLSSIVNIEE